MCKTLTQTSELEIQVLNLTQTVPLEMIRSFAAGILFTFLVWFSLLVWMFFQGSFGFLIRIKMKVSWKHTSLTKLLMTCQLQSERLQDRVRSTPMFKSCKELLRKVYGEGKVRQQQSPRAEGGQSSRHKGGAEIQQVQKALHRLTRSH